MTSNRLEATFYVKFWPKPEWGKKPLLQSHPQISHLSIDWHLHFPVKLCCFLDLEKKKANTLMSCWSYKDRSKHPITGTVMVLTRLFCAKAETSHRACVTFQGSTCTLLEKDGQQKRAQGRDDVRNQPHEKVLLPWPVFSITVTSDYIRSEDNPGRLGKRWFFWNSASPSVYSPSAGIIDVHHYMVFAVLGIDFVASCTLDKNSANWAAAPALERPVSGVSRVC